ncbi:MAG TPA: PCP reductase family protein [Candidatus Dormibacteraeota bacterium]|nr:PCP reductase family protein [Candidatus Dormibacteraeota bacterium]
MADQPEAPRCPVPHDAAAAGCPVPAGAPHPPLTWTEDAHRAALVGRDRAPVSRIDADRAVGMAERVVEARAERDRVEEITDLFVRTLGKKLGYGHPLSERTGTEVVFTWTPEAEARLADVPEFCRDLTRWRVEWTAHKLGLGTTITPAEMDVKYELWGRVSHAIEERDRAELPWTESARSRFERIPDFVRGQVLEAVEGNARTLGLSEVNDAVVDLVIDHWVQTGDFHEGRYGFK